MREYYFLAALLPQLEIGHVPTLGVAELKELLQVNVSKEDLALAKRFLRQIDIENFRAFWAKEPLDPRGNLNRDEIEQAIEDQMWSEQEPFPDYLVDYLSRYLEENDRISHFHHLLVDYFASEEEENEGFLGEYFAFARQWQLVMVGFRAKKLGKDIAKELQFEDATDPIVAQILAQKDAPNFEPPFEYKELRPIFEEHIESPLRLHQALYAYQFAEIVERWGEAIFTIDRILNYLARLILVERWMELDVQKGISVIDTIEEGVK
ncbi:MAG: hypothetical protein S4CHLAM81_05290 [Chlamydiales bacterium]|nr:hypothetical protein [Chlamydiales bacterium]MCH9635315.1 hypothetical protein [Chlamydiales bacterium]